jgi:ribosomal protein S18 acetylase RimI-like enzyme
MEIRTIRDEHELTALAALAAPLQQRPATHVIYFGTEAVGIRAELAETTWSEVSAVATDGDTIVGWLVGDVDVDMGRVWWMGPFVVADDWESVATELLAACRRQLPAGVDEEELSVDSRFERFRVWAASHGYVEEEGSYVLQLEGGLEPGSSAVREITDADRDTVARLHVDLIPVTHTTGSDLAAGHDDSHRRLGVETDGEVVAYVAVERQADGSGYIDYMGVAPTARRRGLGADLVRAGVAELRRLGVTSLGLTVRVGSEGARELYGSLGFDEERLAIPLRRGYSLA